MLATLLLVSLSLLVLGVEGTPCDPINGCPLTFFNQSEAPHAKMNAPFTVVLGNLYNNGADSNSLVKFSVTNINNDLSIIPNVKLELYLFPLRERWETGGIG